jgi:hypothetical protein
LVPILVAPPPKNAKDPGREWYFPTKVGARWVYNWKLGPKGGEKELERTYVITDVADKGGAKIVTLAQEVKSGAGQPAGVKVYPLEKYLVSDDGLFLTEFVDRSVPARADSTFTKLDPPWALLKLPVKPDQSWEHRSLRGEHESKFLYRTVGREEIEVPAGKYKAVRVEEELVVLDNGKPLTITKKHWYAPGVGRVRFEQPQDVKELKSFSPGKE